MAYDEGLAFRVEEILAEENDLEQKPMFGGIAWLTDGNIACAVFEDLLILRVGHEFYPEALVIQGISEFNLTGKSMKGWIMASAEAISEDNDLKFWIDKGLQFGRLLPAK